MPRPAPPPRYREWSGTPGPSQILLAALSSRPALLYCSVINVSDGSASPEDALDRVTEGCPSVFVAADSAKRTRAKRARREEVLPCNNMFYAREDAAITYSHDDQCF